MSIVELSIENFKSIISGRAKFTEGINFIYGPNGAGKSSILDALAFALYGSEWLRRSRLRLSDLVRIRSRTSIVRVKVRGVDGKVYTVQRVFTPEKTIEANTYVLDESGKRVASRDREVTGFVEKILNVSVSVFSELLYVRQGELRSILESGRRTETKLDKVLKIETLEKLRSDYLREVRKLAESHIRRIEGKLSVIEEEITKLRRNVKKYREELEKLSDILLELEKRRRELEERRFELERELKEVEHEVSRISQLEVLIAEKEKELKELEQRKTDLEGYVREIEDLRSRLKELEALEQDEQKLRSELNRLLELRARLGSELEEVESYEKMYSKMLAMLDKRRRELSELEKELKRIESLESEVKILEEKLKKVEKARRLLEKLREENAKLIALRSKLEEEIKLLQDSKGVCPLCGRELSDDHRLEIIQCKRTELGNICKRIENINEKIGKYERLVSREEELKERYYRLREMISRKEDISRKIDDIRRELSSLEEEVSRLRTLLENKRRLEKKLHDIEENIREVEKRILQIQEKLKEKNRLLKRLASCEEALKELENVENRLNDVKEEIERLTEELRKLSSLREKYNSLKTELENILEELRSIMDKISELRGRESTLKEELEKLEKEIRDKTTLRDKLREEYSKYYEAHKFVSKVMDVVDKIKPVIRRIFLELLNNELNSMFVEVCHKTAFVGIRVTEDYEIYVKRKDGVELSVDALSVGERNLVALLFRYALAKVVLGTVPMLILDEPTEHLDDEHRKRIAQWLKNVSSEVGMIIITSHVDAFETVADNIIRVEFVSEEGESTFRNT